jgi:putative ABC transport system permease protein
MRAGLWLVRVLARLALAVYPAQFRQAHGTSFVEAVEHRLRREERRTESVLRAVLETVRVLVVDSVVGAPDVWRLHRRFVRDHDARRTWNLLLEGGSDIRLATRMLMRRPGFLLLVTGTLGLGIGVSAAAFGALDRLVLRPLPYDGAERMYYLSLHDVQRGWRFSPPTELLDRWRAASTLDRIEVFRSLSVTRTGDGPAELQQAIGMSAGLPSLLGVRPLAGRTFDAADAEPGATPVVMVSERYWRGALGRRSDIIGRTMLLNDSVFTVIGVWPASAPLDHGVSADLFRVFARGQESPAGNFSKILVRLAAGTSRERAQAELTTLAEHAEETPDGAVPMLGPLHAFVGNVEALWMAFAGGLVLLVVAVLSAAGLVLSRTAARTGEIGIRLALGGSPLRLVRLFLAESALICMSGMAVGIIVAMLVGRFLARFAPAQLSVIGATPHARTLAFALLLAAAAAAVCSLAPLLLVRPGRLRERIAAASTARLTVSRSPLRTLLVSAQVALAVLLLSGTVLLGRSFQRLLSIDVGMNLDHVAVIALRAPATAGAGEAASAFFRRIEAELGALPGVTGITRANNPLLRLSTRAGTPYLAGQPEPELAGHEFISTDGVPAGYFGVLGIPLLAGRDFAAEDGMSVVIVSESFAQLHEGDVIGHTLRFAGPRGAEADDATIIGVVGNVRSFGLRDGPERVQLFYPDHEYGTYTRFLLATSGDPAAVLRAARERLARTEPGVPLREATTGPELMQRETASTRFLALLLAMFAILGLVFAIAGVYGAVSLDTHDRTQEVGVRMALGASGRHVVGEVVGRGLRPVLAGALIGAAGVLWAGPLVEALLYDIPARDPLSVALGLIVLGGAALAACLIPAIRASRIEPATTLRAQ